MSLGVDDSGAFSRLQLARALKEDPDNPSADPPENSAIFSRQRAKSGAPVGQFYIPRPTSLLTPPILGTNEPQVNESQINESQYPHEDRSSTLPPNTNIRGGIATPGHEERRDSVGKPATLLDVRKSMLDTRQSIHNMIPFSPASSHRTSQILQQHKSLPDLSLVKQPHGASRLSTVSTNNSRQSILSTTSSRPPSSNNPASRPTSMFRKSFVPQDSEDSSSSSDTRQRLSPKSLKSKSKKSASSRPSKSKHKKVVDDDELSEKEQKGERSITTKSAKKHKNVSKGKLEKVKEEDSDDSDETDEGDDDDDDNDEEDDDDDESDSEEDDTPLALKNMPKIRVAAPNGTVRKNGGIIEAWLDNVSAQSSSPEPEIHVRHRRPSSGYVQTPSSPLGPGRRPSLTPEQAGNRRPRSSAEDTHPPELQLRSEPRKRANSEFLPKRNSYVPEPQFAQVGRISPSPRQDSGYWARDTLTALSGDARHLSLMNDSSSSFTSSSSSQRHPQHSRSKDSLSVSINNRQSYYMANNNNVHHVHHRASSEHLSATSNRISYYQQQSSMPQQKHRVR